MQGDPATAAVGASGLAFRKLTPEDPFPGPELYAEYNAEYFKGREAESRQLLRMIQSSRLTVLLGASGLGKSSLLLAGVFPTLRDEGFLPLRVQFSFVPEEGGVLNLAEQLVRQLEAAVKEHGHELEPPTTWSSLWQYFHSVRIWNERLDLLTPVVVLDQFEEIFTLGQATLAARVAVHKLLEELSDVLENRIPRLLRAASPDPQALEPLTARPFALRLVFSLREEYVPALEALHHTLPGVRENHLRLTPFHGKEAATTIGKAGAAVLADGVAEVIIRALSDRVERAQSALALKLEPTLPLDELNIEPSLLNLFCFQLNKRRGAQKIDTRLVEEAGEDILADFYADCVGPYPPSVAEFIEDKLLMSGYRVPVPETEALMQPAINAQVLTELEAARLIRREPRHNAIYIELVHDVLTRPILERQQQRHQDAQRREQLRQDEAVRRRQRKARDRRRRARLVATAVGILVTSTLVGGVIAHSQVKEARRQVEEARVKGAEIVKAAREEAEQASADAEEARTQQEAADKAKSAAEAQATAAEARRAAANEQLRLMQQRAREMISKARAETETLTRKAEAAAESARQAKEEAEREADRQKLLRRRVPEQPFGESP